MKNERPNVLLVTGFGGKGIDKLADALDGTGKFASTEIMRGCPWWHAATNSLSRVEAIEEKLAEMGNDAWLIAHSAGGHYALAAACRSDLSRINGVFINGALNPDVTVAPPPGRHIFKLFTRQYRMREDIMRACMVILKGINLQTRKRYVTVVSPGDMIVPPDSQKLPGVLPSIELPPEIRGHSMSPAKIAAVVEIITERIRQQQC